MLRYLLLAFTIYFAYRFIVNFLIPVVKTTRQVKKQFDSVREQQAFHQQAQQVFGVLLQLIMALR
jgi:ATP/ADP translocase